MKMKNCSTCREDFPSTDEYFPRTKPQYDEKYDTVRYEDGLFTQCKVCKAKTNKRYNEKKKARMTKIHEQALRKSRLRILMGKE